MRRLFPLLLAAAFGATVANANAPADEPKDFVLMEQRQEQALVIKADGKLVWKADRDTVARLLIEQIHLRDRAIKELRIGIEQRDAVIENQERIASEQLAELDRLRKPAPVAIKPKKASKAK